MAGEFGLQFYAAAPQTHHGYKLGTSCLLDQKQRYLTAPPKLILQDVAALAMDEIELRLAARRTAQKNALLPVSAKWSDERRAVVGQRPALRPLGRCG